MTTARGRSQVERSKDDARGAEPKSGTLLRTPNGFFAQFSIGGGQRKGTLLRSCATEEDAEKRKAAIARLIGRLREAGYASMIPNTIRQAGKLDDEGMAKLARLVERIAEGKEPGLVAAAGGRRENLTVQELADLWTTGKLAEEYPDHVRSKRSSDADARMLGWLSKVRMVDGTTFGDREVANVTLDDCDHVMRGLPKTAESPASRRQYAQALRKLLVYAVYPLRLRETLPIPKGWLPKTRSDKAKAWIYPSEDLALMQCREVPLVRRLFYGLLVREGLRVTEALALTWADLDLERGVLRLDANKTDDPRSWALGEDVARALALWKKLRGKKAQKVPRVFPKALIGERWPLARALREGLTLAGVTRPELTIEKEGRRVLRAHDLRGSFVTLALAAGRTEAWVTDRTGHRSSQMIYLYKRAARTAAELGLGWLAPLDQAIPELTPKASPSANGVQTGGSSGPSGSIPSPNNLDKSASRALSDAVLGSWKSCVRATVPRVRIPLSPQVITGTYADASERRRRP
jgi:integrase